MNRCLSLVVAVSSVFIFQESLVQPSFAQNTHRWTSPAGPHDWENNNNWDLGKPGQTDNALFDVGGQLEILLNQDEQIQFFTVRMGAGSVLLAGGNQLELFEESVIETGTLTMNAANLLSGNDLIIGEGGTAGFQLSSATATNRDAILGMGGGTGSALVGGSTSVWTNRNLYLGNTGSGFDTGTGHLTINSGARVNVGGGASSTSAGAGLVIRDTLGGPTPNEGNLVLRNGSTVHVDAGIVVSNGGLLSLDGANSRITTNSILASAGDGELLISGGSSSASDSGRVDGRAEISGAGSQWLVANKLSVNLDGLLLVSEGALVEANRFVIADFGSIASPETRVTGANSRLIVNEQLAVGSFSGGSLFIGDGGFVSASDLRIGPGSSSFQESGSVAVDGSGSQLNLSTINGIAASGRGSIHVRNGGTLNTGTATFSSQAVGIEGQDSSFVVTGELFSEADISIMDQGRLTTDMATITTNGSVSVDGLGSNWSSRNLFLNTTTGTDDDGGVFGARVAVSNAAQLIVGNDDVKDTTSSLIVSDLGNNGNLILRDGASLDNDADAVIGLNAGSTGTVTIDGFFKDPDTSEIRDTRFNQLGSLVIGDAGDGFFQATNQADSSAENIVLAEQTGSLGSAVINGAGTNLSATDGLTIAREGVAGMFVENSGTVTSQTARLGSGSSGVGSLSITGENSSFNSSRLLLGSSNGVDDRGRGNVVLGDGGRLLVGDDFASSIESEVIVSDSNGTAELVLRNGSMLENSGIATIGNSSGAQGTVLLNGVNSNWTNSDDVTVGLDGTGSLRIENGASLTADQNASIAENAGSSGSVTVTGSGSQWDIANGLSVGKRGLGNLTIEDQGMVIAPNINVGLFDTGTGEIFIHGLGSELQSETSLNIGGTGQSTLMVENGGLATSGDGFVSNSQSVALITGTQSRWLNSDSLTVGLGAILDIENGGFVDVGSQTTVQANGTIGIRGSDSELSTQSLTVGEVATQSGTVLVEDGGRLSSTISNVGMTAQTSGLVVVRDAGSVWETSSINVGAAGGGEVRIFDGGNVDSNSVFLGRNGDGTATVSGIDSHWDVSQQVAVGWGNGGNGSLGVGQGGLMESLIVGVGDHDGSSGFVEVTGNNSRLLIDQSLSLGSNGFGSLLVANHGFVSSDLASMGASSNGSSQATVSTNGVWQIDIALDIGSFGDSNITIESGGQVLVGNAGIGQTEIGEFGSVELNGGSFDFGLSNRESIGRISGTSGSLFGAVETEGYNHVESFSLPELSNLDTSGVRIANAGVLFGDGTTSFGLQNQTSGEVRVRSDEWMRFGGVGSRNAGEINIFSGLIEFENDFINLNNGFIAGRGQVVANGGLLNEGVMAFSSGQTDILGNVFNLANGSVITSGRGTTTFFDDVIHNGSEIRTAEGSATVFLGDYTGAGAFTGTGDVFFEGDLRPGNSPDIVMFAGDVYIGSNAFSEFELGGIELGLFDQLRVAGDISLDGELGVSLIDGFQLMHNQEFLILDIDGNLSGQFNGLAEGSRVGDFGGHSLYISYAGGDGNDVSLFTSVPEPSGAVLICLVTCWLGVRRHRNPS